VARRATGARRAVSATSGVERFQHPGAAHGVEQIAGGTDAASRRSG
jgi:hypothetical protein